MQKEIQNLLKKYQDGAQKTAQDLKDWNIASAEALKLESDARAMWYEDMENLGFSRYEAQKIWYKEIVEGVLLTFGDEAWESLRQE